MNKGLQALERITETFYDKESEDIKIVRKNLTALQIIKEKVVAVPFLILHLSLNDLNGYNKAMDKKHKLTQEEFDLLKEVLLKG